jgi:DNA-binding XRE family transcriptional regulator
MDKSLIKAGRAMLDWSQEDLARAAGVAKSTVADIEAGSRDITEKTGGRILTAFERAGVEIRDGRIGWMSESLKVLEGDDCYLRLLDDVIEATQDIDKPELLIFYGDDAVSPPLVIEKYRAIRAQGVRMRQLVQAGNHYLMGEPHEYRWVPEAEFTNSVLCVYADKVAFIVRGEKKRAVISRSQTFSDAMQKNFMSLWARLDAPERSDAKERF